MSTHEGAGSGPRETNKEHYHCWIVHRDGRMIYRLARGFHTRQAADQWAKRHRGKDERLIRRCWRAKCAPQLD